MSKSAEHSQTGDVAAELNHWQAVEASAKRGFRQFWTNHPRVAHHYGRKSMIDGHDWRTWLIRQFRGPAPCALELGCGTGGQP